MLLMLVTSFLFAPYQHSKLSFLGTYEFYIHMLPILGMDALGLDFLCSKQVLKLQKNHGKAYTIAKIK